MFLRAVQHHPNGLATAKRRGSAHRMLSMPARSLRISTSIFNANRWHSHHRSRRSGRGLSILAINNAEGFNVSLRPETGEPAFLQVLRFLLDQFLFDVGTRLLE